MEIAQNVSLVNHSTMGLGGQAAYLVEVSDRMQVLEALSWAQTHGVPAIMIGGGSNIVWKDEGFPGLVIVNNIMRYEVFEEDETNTYITVGAGEVWDSVVERSVAAGLTGIEALSLIPGKTGATPVQNVGAYGQEIAQTLTTIEAFDTQAGDFVTLAGSDCAFGYRTSRFKTTDHGRFFITSITLHLTRGNPQPPFYSSVQAFFEEQSIHDYTPAALREAVVAIRTRKLPDPAIVKNTGSFFGNPIISEDQLVGLQATYEALPHWPADEGIKLSAAWLIEQAGFKDFHDPETGMGTWPRQSLVLINEKARSTADLLIFKQKIVAAVQAKFGITLEQEPELLP
ncbi:MAG TPA: UDP-N-acetylmuramate dehydrogenase [Candidatus Saccharimonadales bacterium]|jgi:UDP-N-acetylmuramate dehydrogenase|nr:UDP-N-acetylmuramate dehydrogenase [Candidatus Saccharimonadales bacterium]